MIQVDLSGAKRFFTQAGPDFAAVARAHEVLSSGSGLGADFTGWLHLPQTIRDTELDRILAAADLIRSRSKALVVIGIGGSYLGARGAIELLRPVLGRGDPEIFFVGNGLSADALCDTLERHATLTSTSSQNPAPRWNPPSPSASSASFSRRNTVQMPTNTSSPRLTPGAAC